MAHVAGMHNAKSASPFKLTIALS